MEFPPNPISFLAGWDIRKVPMEMLAVQPPDRAGRTRAMGLSDTMADIYWQAIFGTAAEIRKRHLPPGNAENTKEKT